MKQSSLDKELNDLTNEICDSNLKIESKLKLLIIIRDHYKNYEITTGIKVEQDTKIIDFTKYR